MASLAIVALLVVKGFPGGVNKDVIDPVSKQPAAPIQKAKNVNQLLEDSANQRRQALENQTQ
ncbi:MAG: hypothetical protein EP300_01440 [Gammaproteobacteria bacterium]|nr:MAG: hypothetical protein EP300_01440 [Gammaproteobacteria bacterium]